MNYHAKQEITSENTPLHVKIDQPGNPGNTMGKHWNGNKKGRSQWTDL